jgi:hypothetical protein
MLRFDLGSRHRAPSLRSSAAANDSPGNRLGL